MTLRLSEDGSSLHFPKTSVVLTTSTAEQDILNSYDLHANCYISKPVDLEQFIAVVDSIRKFWFNMVTLPSDINCNDFSY